MVEGRGVGVVLCCSEQVGDDDSEDLQLFARVNGRFWFGTWNGLRCGGLGRDWRDFVFLAKCMNHKGNM